MLYHFMDYKGKINEAYVQATGAPFHSDLFSVQHIVFIVLIYVAAFLVPFLLRKMKKERITILLRVLSIVMVLWEIFKISWESYHDIAAGLGFNALGLLPLYTCSLFIYTLLAAAWTKGKPREYALSFITTISLLYGAVGVVYCNGLNFYPFWTFGAFYSLFFHSAMFMTGVFLLMTGYYRLTWKDCMKAMVPVILLALIAIPVDYELGADYMLLYSAGGVPLYEGLAAALAERKLRSLYTLIMLLTHIPLSALVIGIYKLLAVSFTRTKKEAQS